MRRGRFEATMARPPPCFLTRQGGAYSRSARNRRFPPLPRPGQRRVDGSPFGVGRRESAGLTSRVSTTHAPRACTPPSQGEKILSARRAGQAGRRAGSGKRALGLRLARPPPRGEGERAGPRGTPPPAPSEGGRELQFSVHLQRGWWYAASRQLRLAALPCSSPGMLTNTRRGIQYVIT